MIQSELHSDMQRLTEMLTHLFKGTESNSIVGLYLMWVLGYLKGSSLQYERTMRDEPLVYQLSCQGQRLGSYVRKG